MINRLEKGNLRVSFAPLAFPRRSSIRQCLVELDNVCCGVLRAQAAGMSDKRWKEHRAGRWCAANALAGISRQRDVPTNPDRSPRWPDGSVGSITHSHQYAWAVAARDTDLLSIGVDTEPLVTPSTVAELSDSLLSQAERLVLEAAGLTRRLAFTVAFSAKEAAYKCLYPLGVQLEAAQAQIVDVHAGQVFLQLAAESIQILARPIGLLPVRFASLHRHIFSACWLPVAANQAQVV